jgi:hypothetical protein
VLVNDEAEMLGVLELVLGAGVLVVVLVVEDELPQAATPKHAVTASAAITALLFSKCTITSLSFLLRYAEARGAPSAVGTRINLASRLVLPV